MAFEGIVNATEHKAEDGSKQYTANVEMSNTKKDTDMNDLAGLMALMQGNMNKDLPGMLALCKDKGYDGNQWWWIIIILFCLFGGNFNFGNNRGTAAGLIGAENLQMITSTFDRIAAAQAVSTEGFANLNTHLCDAIANTIASVRNQSDRTNDNINNVSRQISQCCCGLESTLADVQCSIRGVSRDVADSRSAVEARIALSEERLSNKIELGNSQLACLIKDQAKDAEIARLGRENCRLENLLTQSNMTRMAQAAAQSAVSDLQSFAVNHYTPTRTGTTTTA